MALGDTHDLVIGLRGRNLRRRLNDVIEQLPSPNRPRQDAQATEGPRFDVGE